MPQLPATVPESATYSALMAFERRVDATLARKRADVAEALRQPERATRVLRVYVFNTWRPASEAEPASWTLHVQGRLQGEGGGAAEQREVPDEHKFSRFVKRLTVTLDQAQFPGAAGVLRWESDGAATTCDGFEVKRSAAPCAARVELELAFSPERFRLSEPLQAILRGLPRAETRARVITALWRYIKANSLQDEADPTLVRCDEPLRALFGVAQLPFQEVSDRLGSHLTPLGPIVVNHNVQTSGDSPSQPACYDIAVDVPVASGRQEMAAFLDKLAKEKEIETCDERISAGIAKIAEHKRRRAFFLGFSHSPVEFINSVIASQAADLQIHAGEGAKVREAARWSEFYTSPWVEDATMRYLARRSRAT